LKGLDKLEYLGLTDCIRVGDDALVHIAALRNLTGISLQFTRVTDDGLRRLYGMPKLARVSLLGSKATPQGRQALLKALPVGVDTY
jgi:hypothetical protein